MEFPIIANVEEVKSINSKASYFRDDPESVFPSRVSDYSHVAGNPTYMSIFKNKLMNEIETDKRIIKRFNSTRMFHKRTLSGNNEKCFDLEKGLLFYDGDRLKGTKYGHLRAVQYKLITDIMKGIKNNRIPKDSFIDNFPRQTGERINYLAFEFPNRFDPSTSELSETIGAYNKAIQLYHMSEREFLINNNYELKVDVGELKEVIKVCLDFANRKPLFKL